LLVDRVNDLLFTRVVLSLPDRFFDDLVLDAAVARFTEQAARDNVLLRAVVITGRSAVTGVCL